MRPTHLTSLLTLTLTLTLTLIPILLTCTLISPSTSHAQVDYTSSLFNIPNLSPQLTQKEVTKQHKKWKHYWQEDSKEKRPRWDDQFPNKLKQARASLQPRLPKVTSITLYSIYPTQATYLAEHNPKLAKKYAHHPRFHDYPILGQIHISDPTQANQWVDFMRDQAIPRVIHLCWPSDPRHGITLHTAKGKIDLVICYSCDTFDYYGTPRLSRKGFPTISGFTGLILNKLFDKNNIPRDRG